MITTVFSYQAFISKYLHVIDLILHELLITQKQAPELFCKKDALKNFAYFLGKQRSLLTIDSNTGVFL